MISSNKMRADHIAWALAASLAISGCAAHHALSPNLAALTAMRGSPAITEAAKDSPDALRDADRERDLAIAANDDGDDIGRDLHAARAQALYEQVRLLGRIRAATDEENTAHMTITETAEKIASYGKQREDAEREGAELDRRVTTAREILLRREQGMVSREREAARVESARNLAQDASFLCAASELLGGKPALASERTALDSQLSSYKVPTRFPMKEAESQGGILVERASRARARCLESLSKARRDKTIDAIGAADVLFKELSDARSAHVEKKEPTYGLTRDERGVLATVDSAFTDAGLTEPASAIVGELSRVASAHPTMALQIIVRSRTASPAVDAIRGKFSGIIDLRAMTGENQRAGRIEISFISAK